MLDPHLSGKNALITGGATGIGFAIAHALADQGVNIAIASRDPGREAIESLSAKGVKAIAIRADLREEEQVVRMVDTAIKELGGIDLFINNAAAHWDESVTQLTSHGWFNTLNANLTACVWACRDIARHMIDRGSGSILIVGSTATRNPLAKETAYRVSKSGLNAYAEVMAIELAPYGIRVNVLTPGAFHTRMTKDVDPRLFDEVAQRDIPLRRVAQPEEIGASAVLLLSDKLSAYTTGADLLVDGGISLRPLPIFSDEELRSFNAATRA
jgi:NAD(P)-dependent dehydrogenase (short-subunit alcohol dehydrogenase family)